MTEPKRAELIEPDERWQLMLGNHADLVAHAAGWPTHPEVNAQIAEMLKTCRALFAHSYFVYEFGPVAVVWSVLAVEAALRDRLGEEATQKDGLKGLIGKAEGRGWFSHDQVAARVDRVFGPLIVAGRLLLHRREPRTFRRRRRAWSAPRR